jgi:hypothetical protein
MQGLVLRNMGARVVRCGESSVTLVSSMRGFGLPKVVVRSWRVLVLPCWEVKLGH